MILIALGANLPSFAGPPAATLLSALTWLEERGVRTLSVSSFYATQAWPDPDQPAFVNAVASVATTLQPVELLALLHGMETAFGRLRSAPNAPRTLDLDLLDHEGRILSQGVVLPHPRMAERSFVMAPLAEIAPDWRHPITGLTAAELLVRLPDRETCKKLA